MCMTCVFLLFSFVLGCPIFCCCALLPLYCSFLFLSAACTKLCASFGVVRVFFVLPHRTPLASCYRILGFRVRKTACLVFVSSCPCIHSTRTKFQCHLEICNGNMATTRRQSSNGVANAYAIKTWQQSSKHIWKLNDDFCHPCWASPQGYSATWWGTPSVRLPCLLESGACKRSTILVSFITSLISWWLKPVVVTVT